MEHCLKLASFKEIFKSAWVFYKANWKNLVLLFVPLEIGILFSFICLDLIPETDFFFATIGIVFFTIVSFVLASFSKLMVLDAPRVIERVVFGENMPRIREWYLSMFKKIIPLSLVMFLVFVANFTLIFLAMMLAGVIFTLVSMLVKLLPSDSLVFVVAMVSSAVLLGYVALRYIIKFFVGGSFSVYMYIFDGRKGLDAVTGSFLLTDGRQFSLFWRIVCIWVISLIPFVVFVFPINASIAIDNLSGLYQAFLMQQEPVLAKPTLFVTVMRDAFTSIASLISVSLLIVLNYFLWKDVKATVGVFDEIKYKKTRNLLRSLVGAGILIFVAVFATAMIYGAMFG